MKLNGCSLTIRQRLKKIVLLVGFNCLVIFVLTEIGVRMFFHRPSQPSAVVQREAYWTNIPNLTASAENEDGEKFDIRIDEHGFRNPPGILATAQIILIGDSFTEARNTPEEQTLASILRGQGYVTYNAGMGGSGTVTQSHILADMLTDCDPELVIIMFYLGNDLRDNYFLRGDNYRLMDEALDRLSAQVHDATKPLAET